MTLQAKRSPRINSVDALRGFAVMAILLVHNLEHFIFPVYPSEAPQWLAALDKGVFNVTFFLFAGKAYAIFALLFGFTFYIQNSNEQRRDRDFGGRFMWRLLLLAGFACVNAAFFPAGDVLLLFALVGGILALVRHRSDRFVAVVAVLCLLQPIEWVNFILYKVMPDYSAPDLGVGRMYEEVAGVTASGNFVDFIVCNLGLGQKASLLWAVGAGRFMQTAGLFLLGFLIGRKQLFVASERNNAVWKKIFASACVCFIPLYFIHSALSGCGSDGSAELATIFDMWQKLAFTFVLIGAFVLLYELTGFKNHSGALRLYGRMSLTNYISQSIIGAVIYFPFGLYLAPYCGYAVSLMIGVGVFVVQVMFCKWWLGHHRQGPLETLWHKLTWIGTER